jgi:hypothetical protein
LKSLVAFPSRDGGTARLPATTPALWELQRLARELVAAHGWTEAQAAWFLLTGAVPVRWPLMVQPVYEEDVTDPKQPRSVRRIEIRADAWLPASAISEAYQRAVRMSRGGRPVSERQLRLALFVQERSLAAKPPWSRLRREWNESHRRWTYASDRAFASDARAAVSSVSRYR